MTTMTTGTTSRGSKAKATTKKTTTRKPSPARAKNAQVVRDAGAPGHVLHPDDIPRRGWRTDLVDPVLSFVVYGIPAGQGSKAFKGFRNGKPILKEQSDFVAPWREAVREMARRAIAAKAKATGTPWAAIDAPVMVSAVVTVPPTKAATARGDVYATGTPDLDKLERAIGDALAPEPLKPGDGKGYSEAATAKARETLMEGRRKKSVLHDDSRIVVWDHVTKVYPSTTVDSLGYPGVLIQVWLMADLDRVTRRPTRSTADGEYMALADLAAWARPATGETWSVAAARLWADPDQVLAAGDGTVRLRGRAISDDSMRTALRALATQGPQAEVPITEEPVER